MRYLARHRIPVPITATVRASGVPRQLVGEPPYVVKPRLANAAGELQMIHASEQLPARNDTYIAQDFAPGEEYAVQVHRSVRDGVMTAILLRSDPAGQIERLDPAEAPGITELARVVARTLDLTGAFSVSVRRTADGLPVVLRVDPMMGLHSRLAPELLDGVLGDAGLPLFVPQRKAMAGLPGR